MEPMEPMEPMKTKRTARDRSSLWLAPFGVVALFGCRRREVAQVTADPTPVRSVASTVAPPAPTPSPPTGTVEVTTSRIELARKGHPPVVLELPVVRGLRDPAVQKRVDALLAPEVLLGESLADARAEARAVTSAADLAGGLQSSSFTVEYDAHGILDLLACSDWMGAYPSQQCTRVLIDLERGAPITAADAFLAPALPTLAARLDKRVRAEASGSAAARDPDFGELVADAGFDPKELAPFRVDAAGVTFFHDYGFPHVALGLQPPGEFFFPWADLAGDVDPAGPLARVRGAP